MTLTETWYHSVLRISIVVFALLLLFDSGALLPETERLSKQTQNYFANAVNVTARVEPTELNQLTAKIAQRDRELDEREAALAVAEREVSVQSNASPAADSEVSTYILSIILFILLVLIVLNYGLDYARLQEERYRTEHGATA